ncbi:hypothetical protein BJF79_15320 [Actinomadura sp. CNU-125]|uniref:hypothetical protein n=1 Tax=Actinomadura sp. CNU-125 TaxID=1904961 RepID=UPI000967068C|nr:hypothetical protein [Actinomadura sp. CNU-125]OLT21643.1 hypothetical protein BJF79_15320 [Actinomadura sp. CNU-125]
MSLNSHVDVVIIGFGVLGAAAALVTAGTGARVLALDRNVRTGHRPFSSRAARSRDDLRAELRSRRWTRASRCGRSAACTNSRWTRDGWWASATRRCPPKAAAPPATAACGR